MNSWSKGHKAKIERGTCKQRGMFMSPLHLYKVHMESYKEEGGEKPEKILDSGK